MFAHQKFKFLRQKFTTSEIFEYFGEFFGKKIRGPEILKILNIEFEKRFLFPLHILSECFSASAADLQTTSNSSLNQQAGFTTTS